MSVNIIASLYQTVKRHYARRRLYALLDQSHRQRQFNAGLFWTW